MLIISNFEVLGWEHAIRGMRNPMNSWEKSDSCTQGYVWCNEFCGHPVWVMIKKVVYIWS